MDTNRISKDFIRKICELYNDSYDDRIEDSRPPAAGGERCLPGEDWKPGQVAEHKSLIAFQRELLDAGIKMSTSKIKKILISGGCWTTERSREIQEYYNRFTLPLAKGGKGMSEADAIKAISHQLGISVVSVSVNLPYSHVVYKLENKSSNAKRCERYKARKREQGSFSGTLGTFGCDPLLR